VTTWKTGHFWHHLAVRTTATVSMARDRIHQEASDVTVRLVIVDNSAKKVCLDYLSFYDTFVCLRQQLIDNDKITCPSFLCAYVS